MSLITELEKRLGLPPLKQVTDMAEGKTGARIDRILGRLERLGKDSQGLGQALELLRLVKQLDDQGALQRLDELLKNLQPLTTSKGALALLERVEKLAPMLEGLLKEG